MGTRFGTPQVLQALQTTGAVKRGVNMLFSRDMAYSKEINSDKHKAEVQT
jgi:hypothetical protein